MSDLLECALRSYLDRKAAAADEQTPRPVGTPEQQRAWSVPVAFSIWAVGERPGRAITAEAAQDEPARDTFVEVCLVHARALVEFLMGRPGRGGTRWVPLQDDIRAGDFTHTWVPADPARLDEQLAAIDKHLVHLSKTRVGLEEHAPAGLLTDLADGLFDELDGLAQQLRAERPAVGHFLTDRVKHARRLRTDVPGRWPA